jgi:hypothetical protein
MKGTWRQGKGLEVLPIQKIARMLLLLGCGLFPNFADAEQGTNPCVTQWGDWMVTKDPTIKSEKMTIDSEGKIGTAKDDDEAIVLKFDGDPAQANVSATLNYTIEPGEKAKSDTHNCQPPQKAPYKATVDKIDWEITGIAATPPSGTGASASFAVNLPDDGAQSQSPELKYTIKLKGANPNWTGEFTKSVPLIITDLDIVHPATGELAENKEDKDDGGYVSIRRMSDGQDLAPVTKLVIHAVPGAKDSWKTRLKFTSGGRYTIYSDEERTQEVTSEQTEFDATQETTLYFQGLTKSQSRGGEEVEMQLGADDKWADGDSVKFTVIQSAFQIQVKAFIPYAWTEAEDSWVVGIGMYGSGNVAKGDNRTFLNEYSDQMNNYRDDSFRLMQTITLTPYKELNSTADIEAERNAQAATLSEIYDKATSVDPSEMSLHYGYMALHGSPTHYGPGNLHRGDVYNSPYTGGMEIVGSATDGALFGEGSVGEGIDWNITLSIDTSEGPLSPIITYFGWHDSYPAYEIIVLDSEGQFENAYRRSPDPGALPGPGSLGSSNSIELHGEQAISN